MGVVQRVAVLDANAVDAIADEPRLYDGVLACIEDGSLRLLWTHVTVDELAAIPDLDRRARLITIAASLAVLVPTGSTVWDFSRLDFSRLGADDDADGLEAFRQGRIKDTRDALISSTARYEGAAVCTRDERMAARAAAGGLTVVRPENLAAWAAATTG